MNNIDNKKGINDNPVVVALVSNHITKEQYEIIEIFISHSLKATVKAKKVILYFLRMTQFLNKEIMAQIKDVQLADEVVTGIFGLVGTEYHKPESVGLIFKASGSTKRLSCNYGIFDETIERISEKGCTIFFSGELSDAERGQIELVKFDHVKALETKLRHSAHESPSSNPNKNIRVNEFYEDTEIPEELANITTDIM